jgi:hypothetical protein
MSDGVWSPAVLKRLSALYLAGESYGAIAKILSEEMGEMVTKSAVSGHVSRLGIANRGGKTPQRGKPLRIGAPFRTCQWPIGEVGAPGFHHCGDAVAVGRPYCPVHCKRAYRARPEGPEDGVAASAAQEKAGVV